MPSTAGTTHGDITRTTHDATPAPVPWSGPLHPVVVEVVPLGARPPLHSRRRCADVLAACAWRQALTPGAPVPSGAVPPAGEPEERAAWLAGLRLVVDAAEAAFTTVLADFDANGDGEVLHAAASTQAWLRGALGMAAGEASERVRIARTAGDLLAAPVAALMADRTRRRSTAQPGASAEAVRTVTCRIEHLRTIHRTVRALPPSARPDGVGVLTDLGYPAGRRRPAGAGRHLRHVVDPDGSARHAEEDFGRRWLSSGPDARRHALHRRRPRRRDRRRPATALAPFLVPTGPDDTRTTDQRRADGLAEVVAVAVRSGDAAHPVRCHHRPAGRGRPGHPDRRSAAPGAHPGERPASTVWLTPEAASRLACDATVRRLLLDPNGIPLDLGREVRVFTPAQRRALATRDGGCRFPGCGRPAVHTDAHHLIPWAQGGQPTSTTACCSAATTTAPSTKAAGRSRPDHPNDGANGTLTFHGPTGQRLVSALPAARAAPAPDTRRPALSRKLALETTHGRHGCATITRCPAPATFTAPLLGRSSMLPRATSNVDCDCCRRRRVVALPSGTLIAWAGSQPPRRDAASTP